MEDRIILAKRYKEKEKSNASMIFLIVLSICSFALGCGLMFVKSNSNYKPIVCGLLILCAFGFIWFAVMAKKSKKQIEIANSQPEYAIYYENGFIYIETSNVEKINPKDIIKINVVDYSYQVQQGLTYKTIENPNGNITLFLNNKKIYIPQIKNVKEVKEILMKVKNNEPFEKWNVETFIVEDTVFNGKNMNYYCNKKVNTSSIEIQLGVESNSNLDETIKSFKKINKQLNTFVDKSAENLSKEFIKSINESQSEIKITEKEIYDMLDKDTIRLTIYGKNYSIDFFGLGDIINDEKICQYYGVEDILSDGKIRLYGNVENDEIIVEIR